MAQCKQTPQEFIKSAFTPLVAVMCTPQAEKCCEKNNLDFTELLQPFSKLSSEMTYKDPNGIVTAIKNLKLTFLDIKVRPPHTTIARKLLNSSVSDTSEPKLKIFEAKDYKLDIPSSTPWFESWRETFLKVQYPSDHEFTKHFLGCFLVVSSSDIKPTETIVELAQNLNQIQGNSKLPKWFNSNVLKYYVIVHDNVEGNFNAASEAFESLKTSYGANNCFLLRMNSRPPGVVNLEHVADPWSQFLNGQIDTKTYNSTPESSPNTQRHISLEIGQEANETKSLIYHPLSIEMDDLMNDSCSDKEEVIPNKRKHSQSHGTYLSVDDVEQVKALIYGFVKYCLLPYIEKQILILNDAVSTKKGMSKSLFSATKRWFSANKPGASAVAVNNLIYSNDSPELQIRRLGDLYFMFGNYSAAFQAYHLAKRDYNADQAWLYYAGALEMAALSAFMANESTRKTLDYMEESITTYLNTCKMPHFATRATILSLECLKSKNMYGEAAHQLIRMTSEDSDLRSALLLEQAAYCFLLSNMLRKYAFHMVLGGHRFSKAAQKKHSLRCYKQAYKIYENTGWGLATDHIHYTIGRQANNLQHFGEAVESFSKLLKGGSKQSAQQQAVFLREYLTILESKLKKDNDFNCPVLPVPELNTSLIKILLGPTRPLSTPGKVPALGINFDSSENLAVRDKWYKLEEMLLAEASGSVPLIFKPTVTLYTINNLEKTAPIAIINEPIQVSIQLINNLQTVLVLKDIYLVWTHENDSEKVTNEFLNESGDRCVKTYVTKSLIIQGNSKEDLILSLMPLSVGNLTISAVCYTLSGSETLGIKGTKILNVSSGTDIKHIHIKIVPFAPCLQMTFSEINLEFLAGQLQRITVHLQNTGSVPLKNILIATSVPHLLSNCEFKNDDNIFVEQNDIAPAVREKMARKNHTTSIPLTDNRLDSGERTTFHLWIKAPAVKGPASIDLLVYYENINEKSIPRYRLIRHSWNILVQESIAIDMSSQTSYNSVTEEELALALKVTNLNHVHNYSISTEITLRNVVMISKNWVLTKDIVTPKYINLNSQESAHILFKATRRVHKESHYSSIPLNSDKVLETQLQTAYQAFAKKTEKPLLNVFEDTYTNKDRNDGVLLLEWKALVYDASNKRTINGHTSIFVEVNRKEENQIQLDKLISDTLIDINTPKELDTNLEVAQRQVTYNLIHPSIVEHNFKNEKSCIVPVTLVLHSIIDDVISVTVNTIEQSAKSVYSKPARSNALSPVALSNLCWLTNGKIVRTLKPLTTTSVKLSVIVTSPGTFDLGANLRIFCTGDGNDAVPVLQSCEIYSALIVQDTNS